jgi:hypothetical protein
MAAIGNPTCGIIDNPTVEFGVGGRWYAREVFPDTTEEELDEIASHTFGRRMAVTEYTGNIHVPITGNNSGAIETFQKDGNTKEGYDDQVKYEHETGNDRSGGHRGMGDGSQASERATSSHCQSDTIVVQAFCTPTNGSSGNAALLEKIEIKGQTPLNRCHACQAGTSQGRAGGLDTVSRNRSQSDGAGA